MPEGLLVLVVLGGQPQVGAELRVALETFFVMS